MFRLILNGITVVTNLAITTLGFWLDIKSSSAEDVINGSIEILTENPNLRLTTGELISAQGPYVF